jgi:hypothetical protein
MEERIFKNNNLFSSSCECVCRRRLRIGAGGQRRCEFQHIWEQGRVAAVSWHGGGDCTLGAAVVGTLQTASNGLTGRVVRSRGVPVPANPIMGWAGAPPRSPKWAGASLPWWGALCPRSRAICRLIYPLRPLQSVGKGRGL